MHVVITGGSGFVGHALTHLLTKKGHRITLLTRHPHLQKDEEHVHDAGWLFAGSQPEKELRDVDAVVNLAGEPINRGRWTKRKKEVILNSRITSTREVIRISKQLNPRPRVLINASAVGYYGMSDSKTFDESSASHANDFLAHVVMRWEKEVEVAKELGIRTVCTRFGVILGEAGALPRMILPYKFGIGGTIGSGRQWLSWVHIRDAAAMIDFAITNPEIEGPLNVTSPTPSRISSFGHTIAEVLHRPHWLPVPGVVLKAALGEMSQMLLKGQRVIPEKALQNGYSFQFTDLKTALSDIIL